MALVRWDPFRDNEDLFERFNRMWGFPASRSKGSQEIMTTSDWLPPVEISETDKELLIKVERFYGSFTRSFTVPDNADEDKISADFKEGMLYVHLQKTEKAKPKAKEIQVN